MRWLDAIHVPTPTRLAHVQEGCLLAYLAGVAGVSLAQHCMSEAGHHAATLECVLHVLCQLLLGGVRAKLRSAGTAHASSRQAAVLINTQYGVLMCRLVVQQVCARMPPHRVEGIGCAHKKHQFPETCLTVCWQQSFTAGSHTAPCSSQHSAKASIKLLLMHLVTSSARISQALATCKFEI